jgi:hypothetical protein
LVTFDLAPRFAERIGTAVITPASAARRAASPDGPRGKHESASVTMKKHTSSLERYSALPPLEAGVWFAASRNGRELAWPSTRRIGMGIFTGASRASSVPNQSGPLLLCRAQV